MRKLPQWCSCFNKIVLYCIYLYIYHDVSISPADKCIQNIYQELCFNQKRAKEYRGILCSLLVQNKMPIEDIKASITEMMAGGVDTVRRDLDRFMMSPSNGFFDSIQGFYKTLWGISDLCILLLIKTIQSIPLLTDGFFNSISPATSNLSSSVWAKLKRWPLYLDKLVDLKH